MVVHIRIRTTVEVAAAVCVAVTISVTVPITVEVSIASSIAGIPIDVAISVSATPFLMLKSILLVHEVAGVLRKLFLHVRMLVQKSPQLRMSLKVFCIVHQRYRTTYVPANLRNLGDQ